MSEVEVKSYRYLRTAIVGLLVSLGAAVFYQSLVQQSFLASVSAYYYTPAQAIFVGALIGLGACMIALRGTHEVEEVFLNLGGMLATVVAIVPTSRGVDFKSAVRACEQGDSPLLTDQASGNVDCPTVRALADAAEANIENNMVALLVVGLLALLAAVFFALRDGKGRSAAFWWGFVAALVVYAAGAAFFWLARDGFIGTAHYIAAVGLLLCIVTVATANALRREHRTSGGPTRQTFDTLARSRDRYAWIARIMLLVAAVGVVLWLVDAITLFWLEISVALLFAVFWLVQTLELSQEPELSAVEATRTEAPTA